MRAIVVTLVVLCVVAGVRACARRPLKQPAGLLAPEAPRQSDPLDRSPVTLAGFELTPLADFSLEARVLSRHDYTFDAASALAPIDLALGWGRMSDSAVLDRLDITQSARFYSWRWKDQPPLPPAEIVRSSANMHLIPADAGVARDLDRVRVGMVVALRGRLVEANRADGWHWRSSLTREDSGAGACELVLVDAIDGR
jgi:hypothetical protein